MVAAGRDKGELAGEAGGASQGDMASCHKHDPREALHENWERIDKEFFRSISENDVDGLRLQLSDIETLCLDLKIAEQLFYNMEEEEGEEQEEQGENKVEGEGVENGLVVVDLTASSPNTPSSSHCGDRSPSSLRKRRRPGSAFRKSGRKCSRRDSNIYKDLPPNHSDATSSSLPAEAPSAALSSPEDGKGATAASSCCCRHGSQDNRHRYSVDTAADDDHDDEKEALNGKGEEGSDEEDEEVELRKGMDDLDRKRSELCAYLKYEIMKLIRYSRLEVVTMASSNVNSGPPMMTRRGTLRGDPGTLETDQALVDLFNHLCQ